ncbi:NAD-dependent epimerase/dehydratase family protein [Actinophytocola xanthii]|uniref:NAD-dependent epimerase n=1 Tax=Actinophytocola xanthii TaxID=1912961 RepID=A0A1Q8C8R4_9PSEU|nr:NAD-dependent epimerase/dehydratase family protein [Actinophytocola xanthii]OLF10748.1 NAD-dependent epimerase [Actinophytocola xanthii]
MTFHVVVGAGPTGRATALELAETGDEVLLVSRRGTGPTHARVRPVAADATDAGLLTSLAEGAASLVNCAAPAYDRLPQDTPPLAAALLTAATRTGAGYVNLSNCYGLGPVEGPMTEDLPLRPTTIKGQVRADMFTEAMAAHEAGRLRFTEVRPGDFLGPDAVSMFNLMVTPFVLAEQEVVFPGDLDAPHSWTQPRDVGRALATIARDERSWGRAWHPPTCADVSLREVANRLAELAGRARPRLRRMTALELHEAARADSIMAELPEMQYLYERPAVMGTELTRRTFGLEPTPLDEVLRETAAAMATPAA